MFLAEPAPTAYDLRFRLFGVDVRVHPLFWLVSVLLGWSVYQLGGGAVRGVLFLLGWVACVFVSILLHEFGHVLMGWWFGSKGHIVLYTFGGLAIGSNQLSRRWQRIAVLLAGPGAQLLLSGAIYTCVTTFPEQIPASPGVRLVLDCLLQINRLWPILNLLPVFPLDGGQISREICEGVSAQRGPSFAFGLSMVVAGFLGIHSLLVQPENALHPWLPAGDKFLGLMFIMLAVTSFQALQMETERRRRWHSDDDLPWER